MIQNEEKKNTNSRRFGIYKYLCLVDQKNVPKIKEGKYYTLHFHQHFLYDIVVVYGLAMKIKNYDI